MSPLHILHYTFVQLVVLLYKSSSTWFVFEKQSESTCPFPWLFFRLVPENILADRTPTVLDTFFPTSRSIPESKQTPQNHTEFCSSVSRFTSTLFNSRNEFILFSNARIVFVFSVSLIFNKRSSFFSTQARCCFVLVCCLSAVADGYPRWLHSHRYTTVHSIFLKNKVCVL